LTFRGIQSSLIRTNVFFYSFFFKFAFLIRFFFPISIQNTIIIKKEIKNQKTQIMNSNLLCYKEKANGEIIRTSAEKLYNRYKMARKTDMFDRECVRDDQNRVFFCFDIMLPATESDIIDTLQHYQDQVQTSVHAILEEKKQLPKDELKSSLMFSLNTKRKVICCIQIIQNLHCSLDHNRTLFYLLHEYWHYKVGLPFTLKNTYDERQVIPMLGMCGTGGDPMKPLGESLDDANNLLPLDKYVNYLVSLPASPSTKITFGETVAKKRKRGVKPTVHTEEEAEEKKASKKQKRNNSRKSRAKAYPQEIKDKILDLIELEDHNAGMYSHSELSKAGWIIKRVFHDRNDEGRKYFDKWCAAADLDEGQRLDSCDVDAIWESQEERKGALYRPIDELRAILAPDSGDSRPFANQRGVVLLAADLLKQQHNLRIDNKTKNAWIFNEQTCLHEMKLADECREMMVVCLKKWLREHKKTFIAGEEEKKQISKINVVKCQEEVWRGIVPHVYVKKVEDNFNLEPYDIPVQMAIIDLEKLEPRKRTFNDQWTDTLPHSITLTMKELQAFRARLKEIIEASKDIEEDEPARVQLEELYDQYFPNFMKLARSFFHTTGERHYFRLIHGYCFTLDNTDRHAYFMQGSGKDGKSTWYLLMTTIFTKLFHAVLEDSGIFKGPKKMGDVTSTETLALKGKRFATVRDVGSDAYVNSRELVWLASGAKDEKSVRGLYQKERTDMINWCKVFFMLNDDNLKVEVRKKFVRDRIAFLLWRSRFVNRNEQLANPDIFSQNDSQSDRGREETSSQLNFNDVYLPQDEEFIKKCQTEYLDEIFTALVCSCHESLLLMKKYDGQIPQPSIVQAYTKWFVDSQDDLLKFIKETPCTELSSFTGDTPRELYNQYRPFAKDLGRHYPSLEKFTSHLRSRDFIKKNMTRTKLKLPDQLQRYGFNDQKTRNSVMPPASEKPKSSKEPRTEVLEQDDESEHLSVSASKTKSSSSEASSSSSQKNTKIVLDPSTEALMDSLWDDM
jgi:hypothetical protein